MNAMNAMTKKQKTETSQPGDAAHYEELEELQLESVAAGYYKQKAKEDTPKQKLRKALKGVPNHVRAKILWGYKGG